MAARLRKKSRSANYAISVDPLELRRNSPCFIGKLRCVLSYIKSYQETIEILGNDEKLASYSNFAQVQWYCCSNTIALYVIICKSILHSLFIMQPRYNPVIRSL